MIRSLNPTSISRSFKAVAYVTALKPFSSSALSNEKSKRLPSFAEIKAVQLEKYIQEIREVIPMKKFTDCHQLTAYLDRTKPNSC